jgi:hypothetical protein
MNTSRTKHPIARLTPFQRRAFIGVGDADMHDAPHSRPRRRLEQRERVAHGVAVPETAVVETHPVGVVERVHIGERCREAGRIVKT